MIHLRTPHGNAAAHTLRTYGLFLLGSAVSAALFQSTTFHDSPVSSIAATLLIAFGTLFGGLLLTIVTRWCFSLSQTGRLVQYGEFWIAALPSVVLSNGLFSSASRVNSPIAALVLVLVAVVSGTLLGTIPWKSRSWLPQTKKVIDSPVARLWAGFVRIYLAVKANLGDTFYHDRSRARAAWFKLFVHELYWLKANSPARAPTLISLALSHMEGDHELAAADAYLAKAYDLCIKSTSSYTRAKAADAVSLRGDIASRRNDWTTATRLHEEAERLLVVADTVSWSRAHNLQSLSRCYFTLQRPDDGARADMEAEKIRNIIFACNRRLTVYR